MNFVYKNVKLLLLQVSGFPEGHVQNIEHFVTEFYTIKKKKFSHHEFTKK